MEDILIGAKVALSEYPLAKFLSERTITIPTDAVEVAKFLVYANAIVPCEGILHDAETMYPKSVRAENGHILAEATSSCGIRGSVRVVVWEDVLHGSWCKKCFPNAARVQQIVGRCSNETL